MDHSHMGAGRGLLMAALVLGVSATAQAQGIGDECDPLAPMMACASGSCELTFDPDTKAYNGVCCAVECPGSCQVCSDDFMSCGVAPLADPPESEECTASSDYCDGSSSECASKKQVGESCSVESDSSPNNYSRECASRACNDGFCCDRQCDGPCEACSAAAKGSGEDGVCGSALECTSATCDGDHTLTGPNGETTDCSPFRCTAGGDCRDSCTSSSDCVDGTVCDTSFANGVCVRNTESSASGDGGGCAVRGSGSSSPSPWTAVLGLAALGGFRVRRHASYQV